MSYMLSPQIVVLREGTENSKGKEQVINNINACQGVVEIIKTTLVNLNFKKNRVPEEWIK
jgi:T-complex protein 1 subunit eta